MSDSLEALAASIILSSKRNTCDDKFSHSELENIANALISLSQKYLVRSALRPTLTEDEVNAYALYYLSINAQKVQYHLNLLAELLQKRTLSVLDFGCGPGTASLSLASSIEAPLKIDLADSSPLMISTAKKLFAKMCRDNTEVNVVNSNLDEVSASYDLIFACNVFNEIPQEKHQDLLLKLMRLRAPDGVIIIIEPGSLEPTRALMELREWAAEKIPIIHPCTHSSPCPLLDDPTQWCHNTLFYERSQLIRQIDEMTGFNKHRIKFSSLVLGAGETPQGYRVISPAAKNKVGSEALICGANYFGLVQLTKRNRTDNNRVLEKAPQHSLVSIEPPPLSGSIQKDTVITRITRA